jgi:histidinol-phosphate/aromatic aminotransferase/cobyric acid decarboxylase-like protein/choline kinase
MKVIILTAGFGNRMRPLTFKTHKTLLRVGDQTVIEKIINSLVSNGIKDFVIVTGYRADDIRAHMQVKFPDLNVEYVHNPNYETTNNIYSLWLAFQQIKIDQDILLIESDLIYDPSVIARILRSPYPNVALVDGFRRGMDGTVVAVSKGVITNVIPPHLQGQNFDFSDKYKTLNIYKFSASFCNNRFRHLLDYYVKIFDKQSFYELVLGMLIYAQQETINAEILEGELWAEIDDPNDFGLAEYQFYPSKRYEILEKSFGGYWNYNFLDFAYIHNFHFPNASIMAELKANMVTLLESYCSSQKILNQKIANFLWCSPEKVVLLNGASQAYPVLAEYFAGKKVLMPTPTFGEYPSRFQGETYQDRPGYSLEDIEHKISFNDVVIIVNPNNPTGTCCKTSGIYDLAARHLDKTFLIDESFIDFSPEPSIIGLLEKNPLNNVIVIKSLSKCLGVPGLRLGFIYTSEASFINFFSARVPVWNINSLCEFFLELIFKHRTSLEKSYEMTRDDRRFLEKELSMVDCVDEVFSGEGNFILLKLKENDAYKDFCRNMLERHSIYLKDVSKKFPDGRVYIRVAVRKSSDNQILIDAMRSVK